MNTDNTRTQGQWDATSQAQWKSTNSEMPVYGAYYIIVSARIYDAVNNYQFHFIAQWVKGETYGDDPNDGVLFKSTDLIFQDHWVANNPDSGSTMIPLDKPWLYREL